MGALNWILGVIMVLLTIQGASALTTTQYTPSTKTVCEAGLCWTSINPGTRYVAEDGVWKTVETARSLKNTAIQCVIHEDGVTRAECIDYNLTSITMNLTPKKGARIAVPVRIVDGDVEDLNLRRTVIVEQNGTLLTIPYDGRSVHLGAESTVVTLEDKNTEIIEDTYLQADTPSTNYGSTELLHLKESGFSQERYGIIKFNTSVIPNNRQVTNATLTFWYKNESDDEDGDFTVSVSGYQNYTWTEDNATYDNYCAGCVGSVLESIVLPRRGTGFVNFSVTGFVHQEYSLENVSFFLSGVDAVSTDVFYLGSKDNGNLTRRPYLNITYTAQTLSYSENESSIPATYDSATQSVFNITWTASSGTVSTVVLQSNYSGTAANYTMSNTTTNLSNTTWTYNKVLPAGSHYWMSHATGNDTATNRTIRYNFTINKANNDCHVNLTISGSKTTDQNRETDSDTSVTALAYCASGESTLKRDGTTISNPTTLSYGAGDYTFSSTSTGNQNYTQNTTGVTVSLTVNPSSEQSQGGAGGGAGELTIPECNILFEENLTVSERVTGTTINNLGGQSYAPTYRFYDPITLTNASYIIARNEFTILEAGSESRVNIVIEPQLFPTSSFNKTVLWSVSGGEQCTAVTHEVIINYNPSSLSASGPSSLVGNYLGAVAWDGVLLGEEITLTGAGIAVLTGLASVGVGVLVARRDNGLLSSSGIAAVTWLIANGTAAAFIA